MKLSFLPLVVWLCVVAPFAGWACSCLPPPPADQAFTQAAAVFVGTVQQVKRAEQLNVKFVTLQVEQAWKGAVTKRVTVQTCIDGACCGYGFQEKESYLVYAHGAGKSLSVSLCSRTRPLAQADDDIAALNKIVAAD